MTVHVTILDSFVADDCFKHMEEGTEFIKLRKADRQYLRTFYLNEQHDEITWYPTKKPAKARRKSPC